MEWGRITLTKIFCDAVMIEVSIQSAKAKMKVWDICSCNRNLMYRNDRKKLHTYVGGQKWLVLLISYRLN